MISPEDIYAGLALATMLVVIGFFIGRIQPNKDLVEEKRRHEKTKCERDDYKMKYEEWLSSFGRFPQKAQQ